MTAPHFVHLGLSAVLFTCGLSACNKPEPGAEAKPNAQAPGEPPKPPSSLSYNTDASRFVAALVDIDGAIEGLEPVAQAQANSWIVLEKIANLYMQRARLSGSYADYAAAEATLAQAFERAAEGSGPLLTRAALNFTLHRLDPVAADLDVVAARPVVDQPTQAYIARMRGDVAFERGEYELAKTHYDQSLALDENYTILSKLARWSFRRGDFEDAEARFQAALGMMREDELEPRAWLHLQLGIMDLERGRYDEAFAHYREGTEVLGGWWLIEEHIAELATLWGMDAFALELYEDIIMRTSKGEFLDAKAGILLAQGKQAEADEVIAAARMVYEAQLQQFPSAAYGHALDHFLDFGPPERALELAEANFAARPGVPARIGLADARLAKGELAGARAIIEPALESGYVAAELYWSAAAVFAALGEDARAAELRAEAEALNPHIATQ